jgi:uncharacterized protein YhbP (UPF0306 family)
MDDDQTEAIIREYLPQVIHMSLGTSSDNKPWVCEVHFVYDDDLKNLYWISDTTRRHSQDIEANPNAAGTIVTQHHLNQLVRGVYFEGKAHKLEDVSPEHPAYKAYAARFPSRPLGKVGTEAGPRFYRLAVSDWYVFDTYNGPGQKLHIQL